MLTNMRCPDPLPAELSERLGEFGDTLFDAEWRPHPSRESLDAWDGLIEEWIGDHSLPLFVRRPSLGRGSVIKHESGREVVPTDNTPAHWVFAKALNDDRGIGEFSDIPVGIALKRVESENAVYRKTGRRKLLNDYGWKLCHIDAVKLGCGSVESMPIEQIKSQFRRLMSPSNMFLLPLSLGGLGEVPEIVDAFSRSTGRESVCQRQP